jgi:hypothetical protein
MNCKEQCFGCHGLYDVDDDIASSRKSSLDALDRDHEVEKSDVSTYDMYKSRMAHPCVGIVLSFVSWSTRRSTTIRGMDEFLYYYLWI